MSTHITGSNSIDLIEKVFDGNMPVCKRYKIKLFTTKVFSNFFSLCKPLFFFPSFKDLLLF